MTTKEIACIPLPFPSDVSEFRVKVEAGSIYVEVFQRGEDEPLITAELEPASAERLRDALLLASREAVDLALIRQNSELESHF